MLTSSETSETRANETETSNRLMRTLTTLPTWPLTSQTVSVICLIIYWALSICDVFALTRAYDVITAPA
ncbi:unnamed protein product, partial [Iphiclides podalirius]